MKKETQWYECGDVGEQVLDIVQHCQNVENVVLSLRELGLNSSEILNVLLEEGIKWADTVYKAYL